MHYDSIVKSVNINYNTFSLLKGECTETSQSFFLTYFKFCPSIPFNNQCI